MPNYANGKVYKIWSPSHPDEIYIGSTTQPLAKRIGGHRTQYKQYQNGKSRYFTSYKVLEHGDAKIELIEQVNCKCRDELIAREGYYIRTLNCVNKVIPDRTTKEYYQDNRQEKLQQNKQWRENNKDKLKQYREQNKDRIAQTDKLKYQKNKEKIKARKTEKITCDECGAIVSRGNISTHKKSKKHLQALKTTEHLTT